MAPANVWYLRQARPALARAGQRTVALVSPVTGRSTEYLLHCGHHTKYGLYSVVCRFDIRCLSAVRFIQNELVYFQGVLFLPEAARLFQRFLTEKRRLRLSTTRGLAPWRFWVFGSGSLRWTIRGSQCLACSVVYTVQYCVHTALCQLATWFWTPVSARNGDLTWRMFAQAEASWSQSETCLIEQFERPYETEILFLGVAD